MDVAAALQRVVSRLGRDALVIGVIAAAFLANVSSGLWLRSPLGHDESVYLLRARDLVDAGWHTSSDYWDDYRAPGLPMGLSALARVVGIHASSSRALVAVCGAVVVIFTWMVARRVADSLSAAVAGVLLAMTSGFALTSSVLLADVPGAAFALAAVWVFLVEVRRGRLRWSMPLVPLLAFVATMSRFGAPFMIGAGLLGMTAVVLTDVVRDRNWLLIGQVVLLAAAVALTCGLVLFTDLLSLSGSSPVEANRELVGGKGLTVGTGFRDLWRVVNPWSEPAVRLWSKPVALVFVLGLGLAVFGAVLGRISRSAVAGTFIAAVSSLLGVVVSVGLVQPNYLALTLPYWAVLAGLGYGWAFRLAWERSTGGRSRRAFALVAAVAAIVLLFDAGGDVRSSHHDLAARFSGVRATSVAVRGAWGDRCVLVTSFVPQVAYYSGCEAVVFGSSALDLPVDELLELRLAPFIEGCHDAAVRFGVFLVENGKRQPSPDQMGRSTMLSQERIFESGTDGRSTKIAWVQVADVSPIAAPC